MRRVSEKHRITVNEKLFRDLIASLLQRHNLSAPADEPEIVLSQDFIRNYSCDRPIVGQHNERQVIVYTMQTVCGLIGAAPTHNVSGAAQKSLTNTLAHEVGHWLLWLKDGRVHRRRWYRSQKWLAYLLATLREYFLNAERWIWFCVVASLLIIGKFSINPADPANALASVLGLLALMPTLPLLIASLLAKDWSQIRLAAARARYEWAHEGRFARRFAEQLLEEEPAWERVIRVRYLGEAKK